MVMTIDNCSALVSEMTSSTAVRNNKKQKGNNFMAEKKELKIVIIKQSMAQGKVVRIGETYLMPIEEAMKLIHAGKARLDTQENRELAKEALAAKQEKEAADPARKKKIGKKEAE